MILLGIPLKKGLVKKNWLYGVRIKKSFESEELWYKINKYGGERMIFWSFPIFVLALVHFLIPFYENFLLYIIFDVVAIHIILIILLVEIIMYTKKL
jgi:uncharacterized membrane protein